MGSIHAFYSGCGAEGYIESARPRGRNRLVSRASDQGRSGTAREHLLCEHLLCVLLCAGPCV